ncbi:hypothetical protein N9030_01775 [bacterium]|nr:hypothetical protein [bacterium]
MRRREIKLTDRKSGINGSTMRTANVNGTLTSVANSLGFNTATLLGNISLKKIIDSSEIAAKVIADVCPKFGLSSILIVQIDAIEKKAILITKFQNKTADNNRSGFDNRAAAACSARVPFLKCRRSRAWI